MSAVLLERDDLERFKTRLEDSKGREKSLLRKIESALERLANGSFGTCDRCGQEIPRDRLEARPMTTLCIDCKEEQELEERRSFGRRLR